METDIAVVGGGFSGLVAPWLLERALDDPPDVLVLEESTRFGGRIETGHLGPERTVYNAGAAELYDVVGSPQLRALVDTLGLPCRPMVATPTVLFQGMELRTEAHYREVLGAEGFARLEALWDRGTELRPPEAYAGAGNPEDNEHPWTARTFRDVLDDIGDERVAHLVQTMVHSDLVADPERTSGTFGFDNLLIDDARYNEMYTVVGGNERIIAKLLEEIRAPVRLQARVQSVRPEAGGYALQLPGGTVLAKSVLFTLPVHALRQVALEPPELAERFADHIAHHDHPGAYLRVTLLFDRRFWRDELPEAYWVSDAHGGVTVYDQSPEPLDPDGPGILSVLIAGADAEALTGRADERIIEEVRSSLPASIASEPGRVVDAAVDRWFGALGVSALPGGVPLRSLLERHQVCAEHPRVLLTGDYLYDATLCGALDGVAQALGYALEALGHPQAIDGDGILAAAGLGGTGVVRHTREAGALPFLRRES